MKKIIIITIAVIISGGFIWLAAASRNSQEQSTTNSKQNKSFPQAITFSGKDKSGQSISFSKETIQKPTLLIFWAPWCPHCQRELPIIEQVWKDPKIKDKINIITVRIFYESSKPIIINDDEFSFPIILEGQAIGNQYDITAIPTLIFVDKNFKVRERIEGTLSKNELIKKINYLVSSPEKLAGVPVKKLAIDRQAPNAAFTTLNGEQRILREFKGKRVMFWLLATWCPSCVAGVKVLAENNNKLDNLTIIVLKTYGNAGYPGPSIEEFAKSYAPQMLSAPNWLWGDMSPESTKVYNPKNFPDIYFLIDENGMLKHIDGSPAATINRITNFANE